MPGGRELHVKKVMLARLDENHIFRNILWGSGELEPRPDRSPSEA